jgi:transposase
MNRKTKFSISFKETLAKELLSGTSGSKALSLKHGISARYLRRLAKKYEDHGSLTHQDHNTFYEKDFKIACVLSVIKKRLSLSEAATIFGIPNDSTLVRWMKLYGEFGEQGLESTKVGRPKNMSVSKKKKTEPSATEASALQEELEYLRAENAYLKKLSALIQEEKPKASRPKLKQSKN